MDKDYHMTHTFSVMDRSSKLMVSKHPAPFVITAIGDADTMEAALNIRGGVKDLLVNENVQFSLEKKDTLMIDTKLKS